MVDTKDIWIKEGIRIRNTEVKETIEEEINACKVIRKPLSTRTNDKIWYAQKVLQELLQKLGLNNKKEFNADKYIEDSIDEIERDTQQEDERVKRSLE